MKNRYNPHNQPTVPVLDKHGNPLAPARPSRVRKWLETGRASKVWIKGIFAVQVNDLEVKDCVTGNLALNINPRTITGVAITRESPDGTQRTVVATYELQHRNREIHRNLGKRRDCRRARRYRLRRRPARFNNRTKPPGWLPPSTRSIAEDTIALAHTLRQLYPINRIRIEHLKFDTQLLQSPNIRGIEYQQGTLLGWQLRHYVMHRDDWLCRYCGKPGTAANPLELDHVVPRSKDGPCRVDNLVATCRRCNQLKGDRLVEDFLQQDPVRLADLRGQLGKMVPLTDAGHLNSVIPTILRLLENTGFPVISGDAATTSFSRRRLGMPKTPVNDAACIGTPDAVADLSGQVTTLKRQRRHKRQSINCDRHGSPMSKNFPAYSRLPRERQGYTTPPAHSIGRRRLRGISSGDLVRIHHHSGQDYVGRCTLDLQKRSVKLKHQGPNDKTVSTTANRADLIAHQSRWTPTLQR